MKSYKKIFLYIIITFIITNCSFIEKFLKKKPTGSEFDKNLTKIYQDYVKSEKKKRNWQRARKFSIKGMDLLKGDYIFSEDPRLANIDDKYLAELMQARGNIESVLDNKKLLDEKPVIAAKALYSFDCWVEEQSANWNQDDVKKCKDNFYQLFQELQDTLPQEPKLATDQKIEPVIIKEIILPEIVYFAHNKYQLDYNAIRKITDFVSKLKEYKAINLNCYTDRTGAEWYNYNLSKKRCITVKNLLAKAGIKKEKINLYPHGIYTTPYSEEKMKKNSPNNRRVEIIINY